MSCDEDMDEQLYYAAQSGDFPAVRSLLSLGAYVNWQNDECLTPLHVSSFNGHLHVVKELLARGEFKSTTSIIARHYI
ncbi:hypothetical protein AC1031_021678 [Aphanomyces cochlioides]|nr:hypothetical protein AC1031_021678 [Aphanomyces cochlioides]